MMVTELFRAFPRNIGSNTFPTKTITQSHYTHGYENVNFRNFLTKSHPILTALEQEVNNLVRQALCWLLAHPSAILEIETGISPAHIPFLSVLPCMTSV